MQATSYNQVLEAAKDQALNILYPNTKGSPITSIRELNTIEEYGRVTLQVAVIKVDEYIGKYTVFP